jgi:hypothetical protein
MTWWLLIGAMVMGAGVLVIGAACFSFARDLDREECAEGSLVAERKISRAAPANLRADFGVSAAYRAAGMRMATPAVAGRGHHRWSSRR